MAQLENLKDKNADRVRRAAMLKKAQGLPLPDPMIGYPHEARQEAPAPQGDADGDLSSRKAQKAAPLDDTPAEVPGSKIPAAKSDAAVITENRKQQKAAPAPDPAPSRQVTGPLNGAARNSCMDSEQADDRATIFHRVTFQFTQDHLVRAEAIAETLGLPPQSVLKKVAKMTTVATSDFVDPVETVRTGPTFRHAVSFPEGAAIRWIKKQDPLGYYTHPRTTLRAIGRAAFDRAAETLLATLENNKP